MKEVLDYQNLHYDAQNKCWDEQSLSIIADMLEVWDNYHKIVICHPNCIFAEKPVTKDSKDFETINWQGVQENLSFENVDCFINIYPECNDSFKYLHRRFRHELFDNSRVQPPRHLVVLELDAEGGTLVRGIFKATESGLSVAENPLYTKFKAKSIWEKHLRWTSDDFRSLEQFKQENAEETPSEK